MLDNHIDPDAPTKMEMAIDHHWGEMNEDGKTVFVSDEENRTVDRNVCMANIVSESFGDLYSAVEGGNREALIVMTDMRIKFEMEEAFEDFYNA